MVLLLLVGVLLAGFLLNIGGDSGSHVKQVGGTATASAGCPIMPIPDSIDFSIPFITHVHWDFTSFKRSLNNFCDAVGNFASNLWDAVTGAIKDASGQPSTKTTSAGGGPR